MLDVQRPTESHGMSHGTVPVGLRVESTPRIQHPTFTAPNKTGTGSEPTGI